jgi:methylmalonyl-CoA mutase cobalamin-binding domain/chain
MTRHDDGELVPRGLPNSADLVREGHERAKLITPAITRYAKQRGVKSERFYKERCRHEGKITYYINLGLKSWPETRDALNTVTAECRRRNLQVDRVSLTADRRMGLMPEARAGALEETGIMFWTPEDWAGVSRDVELQGIINAHAVGSPASVPNAAAAIGAGISYIGNMAQQSYGYPGWTSDIDQMTNMVIAIAMIAEKRDHGIVLDSYIDDGYCASFHDAATSLGWCLLHRYIAEDLIGAAYSPSYGSTMADPVLKAAFGRALDAINTSRVPPSLIHGDTNSLDPAYSLDRHAALVTSDVFFTIANELDHPTGTSVHATPLTEPIRIPTVEDIVQSLEIANEAERQARQALPMIDWRPVNALRDEILAGGRRVYANMMSGLASLGVNVKDPLELLVATRRLGAVRIEELYGAGKPDSSYPRGFEPIVPTDTLKRALKRRAEVMEEVRRVVPDLRLAGTTIVAASGDVHEYGLHVVVHALTELGCNVVNLGTSVDPEIIAAAAAETNADGVALSTYNGVALSLVEDLLGQLQRRGMDEKAVFVGGRLIQDIGEMKSVDVSDRIAARGAYPCATVGNMLIELRGLLSEGPHHSEREPQPTP